MTVSQATLTGMQLDLHELFNQLQRRRIQMPMHINEMKGILYSIYKNRGDKAQVGLLLFMKYKLEQLEKEARSIKGWHGWVQGGWFYHSTYVPQDSSQQMIFEKQRKVKVYLNPTISGMRVMTDLMRIIINEPEDTRGLIQCKYPLFDVEENDLLRSDKFIIYISEKSSALPKIIQWVKQLPEGAFSNNSPLFTKKIRNGVSLGYPKTYSEKLHEIINRVTRSYVTIQSYGDYMTTIIAIVIKQYGNEHKLEVLDFGSIPDKELEKLESRTWAFVAQQANEDLHSSGVRI